MVDGSAVRKNGKGEDTLEDWFGAMSLSLKTSLYNNLLQCTHMWRVIVVTQVCSAIFSVNIEH